MKDYIKVFYDDLSKKIDENIQSIAMLEQTNMCYDGFRRRLDKALKQPDEVIDKIKEFINELEHNKQVDKDVNIDISCVTCDYVIEKLKDIIK